MKPGIVAIEWAQRMPYKPDSYIDLRLQYADETSREVEIIPFNCSFDETIITTFS